MSSENPTVDVRKGEELDIDAVDAVLKKTLPDLKGQADVKQYASGCLLYTSPSPRDRTRSRMPSSA